jgi:hypothetical protein
LRIHLLTIPDITSFRITPWLALQYGKCVDSVQDILQFEDNLLLRPIEEIVNENTGIGEQGYLGCAGNAKTSVDQNKIRFGMSLVKCFRVDFIIGWFGWIPPSFGWANVGMKGLQLGRMTRVDNFLNPSRITFDRCDRNQILFGACLPRGTSASLFKIMLRFVQ